MILTGGNSQWPVCPGYRLRGAAHRPETTAPSENPKAAISEKIGGFAGVTHLQRVSQRLQQETPQFCQTHRTGNHPAAGCHSLGDILNDVTVRLDDGEIAPIIHEYRESGGPPSS